MKTKIVLLTVLAVTVLFGACVGTNAMGIFDDSVPEEMQCPLEIRDNLAVILFNNLPIEWAPGFTENKVTISLPPGEHTFTVRYYETRTYGGFSQTVTITKDIPATEFIPGHSYRIYKQKIWIIIGFITNVKIKDVTPKK